jgi:hypothetical protein
MGTSKEEVTDMGAGLSTKQINGRIYNRLQTIKRNLERAGVAVVYRNYSLIRFEAEGTQKIGGFNISFSVSTASNGKCAPLVYITGSLRQNGRWGGWNNLNHGTFEQGIAAIINTFSEVR